MQYSLSAITGRERREDMLFLKYNSILTLCISGQFASVYIYVGSLSMATSRRDSSFGAHISVRCHIRNLQSGYIPLCRLSCIILFLIRPRHLCDFRRVEARSRSTTADIRDRIAFDVRHRVHIRCVEYSFPRKRDVGCCRYLPAGCLCRRGIVICFSYLRDRRI